MNNLEIFDGKKTDSVENNRNEIVNIVKNLIGNEKLYMRKESKL